MDKTIASILDPLPAPALSRAAAAAFAQRQDVARRMVRERKIDAATAEAHLRPWLAIACLLGADLPELVEPLADLTARDAQSGSFIICDRVARFMLAAEICPRQRWAPLLAKARDDAATTADLIAADPRASASRRAEARQAALDLDAIARALANDPNGRFPVPPAAALASQATSAAAHHRSAA